MPGAMVAATTRFVLADGVAAFGRSCKFDVPALGSDAKVNLTGSWLPSRCYANQTVMKASFQCRNGTVFITSSTCKCDSNQN